MPRPASELPDVILYPAGGGTGLIGMWKAFDEMEALGWIGKNRPRMFAVQATGCAPIVRAFEAGEKNAAEFPDAHTIASGLRVPKAIGDFLILKILRESNGGAIAVDDEEMIRVAREVGAKEGLFICPEGAACFAALKLLRLLGKLRPVNASSFLTQGRESNILKLSTANDAHRTDTTYKHKVTEAYLAPHLRCRTWPRSRSGPWSRRWCWRRLHFKRANIDAAIEYPNKRKTALIIEWRRREVRVTGVNGGAAWQQFMCERWAAIVLQRPD